MQALFPRPHEHAAIRTDLKAIFVSLELSRSTWVITSLAPGGGEKMSKHSVPSGDIPALLARLSQLKEKARARTGQVFPIIVIQEAGLDGFWIHRVLQSEGIESHVVDPASIATSRRRRRAKTDKIDGEALVRALLAYKRGEPRVCAMVQAPSPHEEDRRRISRDRTGPARQSHQGASVRPRDRRLRALAPQPPGAARGTDHGRWSPPSGVPEGPDQTGARPARAPDRTGQGCRGRARCRAGPGAGEPRRASASGPVAGPARHVWTPPPVQEESLNRCCAGSGAAMCPASAAAAHRPRARMGVRGSGPHHWSALEALSSHLVLLIPSHRRRRHTCPSTSSRRRQPHARRPLTRRRPELDNFRPWRSTPTRSAPSCWPAPPSPASAACGPACAPARSPRARPCAAPSAPRHWPQ